MRAYAQALLTAAGLLLVGTSSCKEEPPATFDSGGAVVTPIAELEEQALALAHHEGCNGIQGMRTAPIGTQPCGGPRSYVTFCALTTDTVALLEKLAELKAAEDKYNTDAALGDAC